jgi:hypothetical protein
MRRHSPPCTLPPSRGALLLPPIASQLTTANATVEKGKLRQQSPQPRKSPAWRSPGDDDGAAADQDGLLAGIVSQADVLSILSPARRGDTPRSDRPREPARPPDGPGPPTGNRPRGIVTCPAGKRPSQQRHHRGRPAHREHRHRLRPARPADHQLHTATHAGMVDLGADGDPDQSLSHQQRIGDPACSWAKVLRKRGGSL